MSLSDAMLANGIVEYLSQHKTEFTSFLCELYDADIGVAFNGEHADNRRMLIRIVTEAQDGSPLSEREYSLHVETIRPGHET